MKDGRAILVLVAGFEVNVCVVGQRGINAEDGQTEPARIPRPALGILRVELFTTLRVGALFQEVYCTCGIGAVARSHQAFSSRGRFTCIDNGLAAV
jgi:hypothetical protein